MSDLSQFCQSSTHPLVVLFGAFIANSVILSRMSYWIRILPNGYESILNGFVHPALWSKLLPPLFDIVSLRIICQLCIVGFPYEFMVYDSHKCAANFMLTQFLLYVRLKEWNVLYSSLYYACSNKSLVLFNAFQLTPHVSFRGAFLNPHCDVHIYLIHLFLAIRATRPRKLNFHQLLVVVSKMKMIIYSGVECLPVR